MTHGAELRDIARTGKRLRAEHLDVRVVASLSHLDHARVGLVVPKHGRSAVDRNRLKRRLRELFRQFILPQLPPLDVVIHARPSAYRMTYPVLGGIVQRIGEQLSAFGKQLATTGSADQSDQPPPSDPLASL